jgi:hypothetical protein
MSHINAKDSYMTVGKLYRLRGMARNKYDQCLRISRFYSRMGRMPRLRAVQLGVYEDIYRDGTLFLCLGYVKPPWSSTDNLIETYKLLTPDGQLVEIAAAGNKSKFAEVKNRKRRMR